MQDIKVLIWMLPIFFIFHDFEEIIFMKTWFEKNKADIQRKYPKLAKKALSHINNITTSSFAFAVWEEFVLLTVLTLITYKYETYTLWLGIFFVFTFHLIIHCVQAIMMKCYVPVVATSIILLPLCFYVIKTFLSIYSVVYIKLLAVVLIAAVLIIVNLLVLHKGMEMFSKWQKNFLCN
ncbi:HXXEE domain-containing protein [Anaerovorax odorimutans]|uniref:HXXEE domain-containing protein n=1 Tax=Anaerovorax odorimutans TaxID=109327 RepID=UPI0003F6BF74|nr:HXXEE domain-containing protein [Anaerovorax odorimutans]